MIYTKEWAYIHIPKTAGTNFKINAFKHFKGLGLTKPYPNTHKGYLYMHNPYSYWEDHIPDRWVFSLVRNPFSRAVSLWKFCNEKKGVFKNKYGYVDFYEFYTSSMFEHVENILWNFRTTQYDFLKNKKNKITVDFYKMETEVSILETKMNFNFSNTTYNKMENYDYRDIYKDAKLKILIQDMFEIDFKTFGYNIDTLS